MEQWKPISFNAVKNSALLQQIAWVDHKKQLPYPLVCRPLPDLHVQSSVSKTWLRGILELAAESHANQWPVNTFTSRFTHVNLVPLWHFHSVPPFDPLRVRNFFFILVACVKSHHASSKVDFVIIWCVFPERICNWRIEINLLKGNYLI